MTAPKHPFESLSPAHVVDAVESLGFWLPGEPFALNSYENRVFLLSDDDRRRWVAKFYRPERWSEAQIREEHAFLDELEAAGVPGAPAWRDADGETLHHAYGFAFALFPHVAGQAPELENPAHLFALGDLIGQVHAVARRGSFQARPVQEPMAISQASCERVLASDWLSRRQRQAYARIAERLQTLLAEQRWPETALQRVHGDCHLGNILGRDEDFALVDFDDCCMAPAIQDLWMLLTAPEADEWQMQLSEVIEGYEQHVEFDRRQLRWIEPLRTLRLMRHSAWLVDRWEDPAFPRAFPWVASEGYWDQHIRILEQQRLALENPRWLA
ncbi:serine/threonine protein kinase [Chromohalobacter canadensis]|uniref:serine/threonine protein kinase n=1 Tax=Chromohalobacter canadensis TaxID=141389 RepID=UPI0021BE3788|nr:serine/threonine protein kinase [Chromohalobacter canadensis]MCT8469470.1 serine/threonine protein kinase [Chromohalobacter canadensis]MCT8472094.1 serine/threonine protein kinase [Chromohalobacter canadensis]MCT8499793.1 serine/threonine protein kinase [Chromohalobacter canadensis]